MLRRANEITQLLRLGHALADLGASALETYRHTKTLDTHYQEFLAALQAHHELVASYFDYAFGERRYTLDNLFRRLDQAIAVKDYATLAHLVPGIVAVLEQNPLHDFEKFKAALQDPNYIIEL